MQLFEDKKLWEDIGYHIKGGIIEDDKEVSLSRNNDTSPVFLEEHSPISDLIKFKSFKTSKEEAAWVVEDIVNNLTEEELRYQDIMIIHPNPKYTKSYVSDIRVMLMDRGINSHIVGVQTSPDDFFQEDSIAITQIYRAKGNEAAVVYVVNADLCVDGINLSSKRNILFTAITRSKAWVRVCGIGSGMDKLIAEYERVKDNKFELNFVYPSEVQRKKMRIIHRDKTQNQIAEIKRSNYTLEEIIVKLQNGDIQKEDIDKDTLNRLKDVLF